MSGKDDKGGHMSKIWDALGAIIITAIVIQIVAGLVAPYVPYLIVGVLVILVGRTIYDKHSLW